MVEMMVGDSAASKVDEKAVTKDERMVDEMVEQWEDLKVDKTAALMAVM